MLKKTKILLGLLTLKYYIIVKWPTLYSKFQNLAKYPRINRKFFWCIQLNRICNKRTSEKLNFGSYNENTHTFVFVEKNQHCEFASFLFFFNSVS